MSNDILIYFCNFEIRVFLYLFITLIIIIIISDIGRPLLDIGVMPHSFPVVSVRIVDNFLITSLGGSGRAGGMDVRNLEAGCRAKLHYEEFGPLYFPMLILQNKNIILEFA